jgi:drug/metabolite transporter (DMT)-like permease
VVLATAGLALLTLPESGLGVGLGDLLTVVCALSFAAHIVIVGHFSAKCSFQVMSLTQICTAALIAGGSFWWAEHPRVHWTPRLLIAIMVTGLLATALGFAADPGRGTSPTRTGLILSLEPVFAWVTSYLVAGESLSVKGVSGALLILSGILLAELKPRWLGQHPYP